MTPLGDKPPPGILEIRLELAPVSQQAAAETKRRFKEALRSVTRTAQFMFSGDVRLSVQWFISERARYETDRSPDVDNILKPLIDGLVGAEGLLIDDNQIQHVSCSWLDSINDAEQLQVELRFLDGEWVPKKGLVFVQFSDGLCLPIPGSLSKKIQLKFLDAYSHLLDARSEANRMGIDYAWAKMLMPSQRVFHRTRVHAFPVLRESDFRTQCIEP